MDHKFLSNSPHLSSLVATQVSYAFKRVQSGLQLACALGLHACSVNYHKIARLGDLWHAPSAKRLRDLWHAPRQAMHRHRHRHSGCRGRHRHTEIPWVQTARRRRLCERAAAWSAAAPPYQSTSRNTVSPALYATRACSSHVVTSPTTRPSAQEAPQAATTKAVLKFPPSRPAGKRGARHPFIHNNYRNHAMSSILQCHQLFSSPVRTAHTLTASRVLLSHILNQLHRGAPAAPPPTRMRLPRHTHIYS